MDYEVKKGMKDYTTIKKLLETKIFPKWLNHRIRLQFFIDKININKFKLNSCNLTRLLKNLGTINCLTIN